MPASLDMQCKSRIENCPNFGESPKKTLPHKHAKSEDYLNHMSGHISGGSMEQRSRQR